ncbi:MAG: SCO family protein [Kangiellaceae bacterium]|nr:SCO family protein [Kangiellaceae bacterium]
MSVDKKNRIILLLALSFVLAISLLVGKLIFVQFNSRPPVINGVVIPSPPNMKSFKVLDHHNQPFSNKHLTGQWHILSYGYTHCPDICPTTLNVLSRFYQQVQSEIEFDNLRVLFYSIDHQRDTVEHLSKYLPFFNDSFVGLTYSESMKPSALAFEKNLGLVSILTPNKEPKDIEYYGDYRVSHGLMLYIINPQGKLQAVLKPSASEGGIPYFKAEQLVTDYQAIRSYFSKNNANEESRVNMHKVAQTTLQEGNTKKTPLASAY